MSTTLYAQPLVPPQTKDFSNELKYAIAKKYYTYDGTMSESVIMDKKNIEFLEGLVVGGIKEAQILIDMIEKWERIKVYTMT